MALHSRISAPQIDTEMIATFVDVVFGYLDGPVPVRLLAETGTPDQPPKAFTRPCSSLGRDLIAPAEAAGRSSRAVYVVPSTVGPGRSGKAEDVRSTGVVLVDLDDGDIGRKRTHLEYHLGRASMAVASGGHTEDGQEKLHLYWRLTEAAEGDDLERVRVLREKIAALAGGDPSFNSLHQPIRVAGTIHGKHGRHSLARIEATTAAEYELSDLEESVARMPPILGSTASSLNFDEGKKGPTAADLTTRTIRAGAVDEVTRFDALSKVIGHWLRNARLGHCGIDEAWSAVVEYNAASISPPWDESRLRREFDALRRQDLENHEPHARHIDSQRSATHFSDDTLAALFVDREGADWRHVAAWNTWFKWTGLCWQRDETSRVREQVRQACRSAAQACDKPHDVRRICSDKTISAVARIAASDPSIATRTSDLDAHPMLLNTPAGVINLETGQVRDHDRDLLLTQITAATTGAGCPRWTQFLEEITDGDGELQAYLQRLAGYCLTGSTREQMFAFLHGQGANGKSVFLQTLASVMGSYAATATLDTFMASKTNRHLTELAGLRAARLVLVPETEPGRHWAEARIKTVTGGERIRANFMHKDHFEYLPQFKLLVAGNHRPALTSVGEAMRRRLHMVPFTETIPPENRDPYLTSTLLKERDGILGWMLEGCADWQKRGLAAPDCITEAANDYFKSEDLVGQWIEECCATGREHSAFAKTLYQSWKAWADDRGIPVGSQKSLGEALRSRGFGSRKVSGARGWVGISIARRHPDVEGPA